MSGSCCVSGVRFASIDKYTDNPINTDIAEIKIFQPL